MMIRIFDDGVSRQPKKKKKRKKLPIPAADGIEDESRQLLRRSWVLMNFDEAENLVVVLDLIGSYFTPI